MIKASVETNGFASVSALLDASSMVALHGVVDLTLVNLVMANPVDTGTSRASWRIGTKESDIPDIPYVGRHPGSGLNQKGITYADPLGWLDGLNLFENQFGYGYDGNAKSLMVATRNQWMRKLNDGHSRQAPSFWVESAFEKAINTVESRLGKFQIKKSAEYRRALALRPTSPYDTHKIFKKDPADKFGVGNFVDAPPPGGF